MPDTLRARFSCITPLTAPTPLELGALLKPLLNEHGLSSALSEQKLEERFRHLIDMIHEEHRTIVQETHVLTFHYAETESYGLINCPNGPLNRTLQIRLFEEDHAKLKAFTTRFVEVTTRIVINETAVFNYDENPSILAYTLHSKSTVFEGTIQKVQKSARENLVAIWKKDWKFILVLVFFGLGLALLSIPPLSSGIWLVDGEWYVFIAEFAARLSSAAIFAALTAVLISYFQNPNRERVVW